MRTRSGPSRTGAASSRRSPPEPADIALVALQGHKDEVVEQEKELDLLASKAGGVKMAPEAASDLWDRRFTMYGARRLSRGLVVSSNLVPVARLGEAVDAAHRLLRTMKLDGAIHAALLDPPTASFAPHAPLDDHR